MKNKTNHIGGEFESSVSKKNINKYIFLSRGTWTAHGSAALKLILEKLLKKKIYHVYLPVFICPSILKTVKNFKLKNIYYDIDKNFQPYKLKLKENSAVILVNYFGQNIIDKFHQKKKKIYFINDLTHDLYFKINNFNNNYFFFSLRKFGIFNFGGWTNLKTRKKKKKLNKLVLLSKYLRLKKKNIYQVITKTQSLKKI